MKEDPISAELVRELCARGEGTRLDFKRDPPYGDWKSKGRLDFLKDLISLANTVPAGHATAHLLLGVTEDGPENFGRVTGFHPEPHISDAGLHEVCVGTLNRVPPFRYQAVEVDGHLVGVVEIRSGERPYFLQRDGNEKLRRNVAYYREGSRNTEASPQQVVEWAREDGGLRLHGLQAEALEVQLTPDLRLEVRHAGRSGDKVEWMLNMFNAGESKFDVTHVRVWWLTTGSLTEFAALNGRPGLEAGYEVVGPLACFEDKLPIDVAPEKNVRFETRIAVDMRELCKLCRLDVRRLDRIQTDFFRGLVEVRAAHRTGRETIKRGSLHYAS